MFANLLLLYYAFYVRLSVLSVRIDLIPSLVSAAQIAARAPNFLRPRYRYSYCNKLSCNFWI